MRLEEEEEGNSITSFLSVVIDNDRVQTDLKIGYPGWKSNRTVHLHGNFSEKMYVLPPEVLLISRFCRNDQNFSFTKQTL